MLPALIGIVSLSLVLVLSIRMSQWFVLRKLSPVQSTVSLPPVRILKPLKGLDAELEKNLQSIFLLDYPKYDVVLGAEDPKDPALEVARKVAAEYPHVPSSILWGHKGIGPNPKINSLVNLAGVDGPDLLLISDSNVHVPSGHLKDIVASHLQADGGLAWSLFRGTGDRGLGGALEALQLNTFVMGGACGVMKLARRPCALGKAMLISRSDLDFIGGFKFLSQYLAEDQVCAEEMASRGRPVVVSNLLVDNVLGYRTIGDFSARHLRWAHLRRHMNLTAYLVEALLNPVFLALVGSAILRTPNSLAVAGVVLVTASLLDIMAERVAGVKRPMLYYPFLELVLAITKGFLWFVPLFSRRLVWRGNVIRIGSRSLITNSSR